MYEQETENPAKKECAEPAEDSDGGSEKTEKCGHSLNCPNCSSHASKAREEGRKEGAVEQWGKDKLAVKESEQPWWKNEKALKALSQTNPKKEL